MGWFRSSVYRWNRLVRHHPWEDVLAVWINTGSVFLRLRSSPYVEELYMMLQREAIVAQTLFLEYLAKESNSAEV